MEKLKKAYDAIEMLQALDLPVSDEQMMAVAKLEKEYLQEEIIPLLKQELEPLVENMRRNFKINVSYNQESGLEMFVDDSTQSNRNTSTSNEDSDYRKKKYILRVVFPNEKVSCNKIVSKTFVDVVEYAGVRNVEKLGIKVLGENIISSKLLENERYASRQYETEPGLYISTCCDTDKKYEILNTINRELGLNLKIEKLMLD